MHTYIVGSLSQSIADCCILPKQDFRQLSHLVITLPKTKIAPEKGPSQKDGLPTTNGPIFRGKLAVGFRESPASIQTDFLGSTTTARSQGQLGQAYQCIHET